MVMMVTQPGRAPPGTASCPVEPARAAASMARTSACLLYTSDARRCPERVTFPGFPGFLGPAKSVQHLPRVAAARTQGVGQPEPAEPVSYTHLKEGCGFEMPVPKKD